MNPSTFETGSWVRTREIFLELSEVDDAARAAALGRLRLREPALAAWVQRLLEWDAEPDPLDEAPVPDPATFARRPDSAGE